MTAAYRKVLRIERLISGGAVLAGAGTILRLSARALAWPSAFSFSGPREHTKWAFMEQALVDISLFAMGFGLSLVLLGIWLLHRKASPDRHHADRSDHA